MKKIFCGAVAAIAFATIATPAMANDNLTYNLDADVGSVCGAYNSNGATITVPFGDLAGIPAANQVTVGAGSATYRCNSAAGFTRTISSLHDGKLVRTGGNGDGNNSIAFEMSHGGGSGLGFAFQSLATAKVTNLGGSAAFLAGQTGGVTFRVNGVQAAVGGNNAPGTTVFAGDYTDVVTIAINAN